MTWDRRKRSSSRRGSAMKDLETSSHQPWACSSLSSSDKFLSLYDKMQEDWEKKNFESLVCTWRLQQSPESFPVFPPIEKPGSKIVFPHITSRGSVVGKKVYCRTAIHTHITSQQKNSTQRIQSSMMYLNLYQDTSGSDTLPGTKHSGSSMPADSESSPTPCHTLDRGRCRGLFLSLAGAAGMRLMCPPLQLPLLEIVLFSLQQLASTNRSTNNSMRGALWRFPLNLALATVKPFCGSLLRRSLTALLFVAQMRIKKNIPERNLRYMPDLYSVIVFEDENLDNKEFKISSHRIQFDDPVTQEADDLEERARRTSGTDLSGLGDNATEDCCTKCVSIAETLLTGEQENGVSDNLSIILEQNFGSKNGRSGNAEFYFVDLELEGDKLGSQKRRLQLNCEEVITAGTAKNKFSPLKRLRSINNGPVSSNHYDTPMVESRNELLVPADLASLPAGQFGPDFPSTTVTESGENQPVNEIEHNKSAYPELKRSADEVREQEQEACIIEECAIEGSVCAPPEKRQGVHKNSFSAREQDEFGNGSLDDLEADLVGDASAPELGRNNRLCKSSLENRRRFDNEHSSPTRMWPTGGADCRIVTRCPDHSDAVPRESCLERPEFNVVPCTRESSSETMSNSSLTCRLNIASETENQVFEPHGSAIVVALEEICRDPNHGQNDESDAEALAVDGDSIKADADQQLPTGPTETTATVITAQGPKVLSAAGAACCVEQLFPGTDEFVVNYDDSCGAEIHPISCPAATTLSSENCQLLQSYRGHPFAAEEQLSPVADEFVVKDNHSCVAEMHSISCAAAHTLSSENCELLQNHTEHPFADHPTCVDLRAGRHSHADQTYLDMQDLLPPPWGQLIFWHGRCKEGRPTLCVLLGKAVRQLSSQELKHFIAVTVSHLEYAELNFFKGHVRQMNILMDLDGLGFMRLPPMNILSSIGAVLNRDYAGRGGWIILVNAPVMLGFVISAIQGVILRPSYNKGAAIDSSFKGFLEGKERIMMMGSKYRPVLQKHFESRMLPRALGGDCPCSSGEDCCKVGNEFLMLPWDMNSHV